MVVQIRIVSTVEATFVNGSRYTFRVIDELFESDGAHFHVDLVV